MNLNILFPWFAAASDVGRSELVKTNRICRNHHQKEKEHLCVVIEKPRNNRGQKTDHRWKWPCHLHINLTTEYHYQGIGTKLIEALIHQRQKEGFTRLAIGGVSYGFYPHRGFKEA